MLAEEMALRIQIAVIELITFCYFRAGLGLVILVIPVIARAGSFPKYQEAPKADLNSESIFDHASHSFFDFSTPKK